MPKVPRKRSTPSLEEAFLRSLEDYFPLEGPAELLVEREVLASWAPKRKFRYDFRLRFIAGILDTSCLVEINGGTGPRSGHATLAGRARDYIKLALAHWGDGLKDQPLFMFTGPQVKNGEAAEIVSAWLRGHQAPPCLLDPPKKTKLARKARKDKPLSKAKLRKLERKAAA